MFICILKPTWCVQKYKNLASYMYSQYSASRHLYRPVTKGSIQQYMNIGAYLVTDHSHAPSTISSVLAKKSTITTMSTTVLSTSLNSQNKHSFYLLWPLKHKALYSGEVWSVEFSFTLLSIPSNYFNYLHP